MHFPRRVSQLGNRLQQQYYYGMVVAFVLAGTGHSYFLFELGRVQKAGREMSEVRIIKLFVIMEDVNPCLAGR